jgi:predicted AlkP superfamily phosphohydrolase/phosphomutase
MTSVPRVLAIGLDGATYDVLEPLAQRGVMPNLRRLMRDSALARMTSTEPCVTPAAWTTFQTGVDPVEHGILDYRFLDHRQGRLRLNDTTRIRRATLFHAVAASGGGVVSLNLPMTWPAPAGVPGIIVGGLDSPSIDKALAPNARFSSALRASGARYDLATIWRRVPRTFEELRAGVESSRAAFRGRATAALIADQHVDWKLMLVQFQTLDSLQHRCWHLLGIEREPELPGGWAAAIERALRALDDAVGELLELADRRGAAVVVASDHGSGRFRGKIAMPELMRQHGLVRLAGWGSRVGFAAERIGMAGRKWLNRRTVEGGTAAVARGASGVLPVDWKRSAAVALHGDLGAMIYLNRPERFRKGTVATPRQIEQTLEDVRAAISQARHPQSDEPLFANCLATAEMLGCDPIEQEWPDVVAIPADGFHTRTKLGPPGQVVLADDELTGTHRPTGVFMVRAPGVRAGQGCQGSLRDAAPTILHLLGIPPAAHMTGRVLSEMFTARTESEVTWRIDQASGRPAPVLSAAEQAVVEARLRDLGYLD